MEAVVVRKRRLGFSIELKIQFLCKVALYIFLQSKFLK